MVNSMVIPALAFLSFLTLLLLDLAGAPRVPLESDFTPLLPPLRLVLLFLAAAPTLPPFGGVLKEIQMEKIKLLITSGWFEDHTR